MTVNRRDFVHAAAAGALSLVARPVRRPVQQDPRGSHLRVNGRRVNQHLADLSEFGRTPDGGVNRVAFSDADRTAREFAMDLMREAQLDVHIDPVGNIIGRRGGASHEALPILFGSHIDSVPNGGNYDGDVGSMAAIEVAHTLADAGHRTRRPLEVVIWCDEESGLTGSRGFVGDISQEELAAPTRGGAPLAEQIRRIGGDPDRMAAYRRESGSVGAYVELHVEQGSVLDDEGLDIGVVEGIVGINQYDVTIEGFANHAGTTPMDRRRNAMLTAAGLVLAVDRIVKSLPGRQVGTVGRLLVEPGAPNVVPGRVRLTVELRDLDASTIESLWRSIAKELESLAARYDTPASYHVRHRIEPALCAAEVQAVIAHAATTLGLSAQRMPSGAGHDAQYLARVGPVGMIFVPSVGGISHSPEEYTRPEHVENGANVLLQTVLRLDQM